MAWTQADIDALKSAMKSGALTVRYSDKSVTYRTLAEMTQLLGLMQDEVNAAAGTTQVRRVTIGSRKGFGYGC